MEQPENPKHNNTGPLLPARWRRALGWGLLAGLLLGLLWLIFKAVRRGQPARVVQAVLPVAVAAAALSRAPSARFSRIDRDNLTGALREAASERLLWTPTELVERLRVQGIAVTSSQRLARDLADFGLASAVRTVNGRPERRWYNLSPMKPA